VQGDLHSLFMRVAVPGPEVVEQWVEGIDALRKLTNPEIARSDKWGSRKRLATIRALAQRPLLVDAVRAVVVTATEPLEIDWFAVLAADASEASLDALMPHAARALEGDVALMELLRAVLDKLPGSDGLSRLREGLSRSWTQKLAASGVDTLATELGVPPKRLRFRASLEAPGDDWRTRSSARLIVDGRAAKAVDGTLDVVRALRAGESERKVSSLSGRSLAEATQVIQRASQWASITINTSLRGKHREQVRGWLSRTFGVPLERIFWPPR
jgi:hypothetical protein